jgi:hypothetical protein
MTTTKQENGIFVETRFSKNPIKSNLVTSCKLCDQNANFHLKIPKRHQKVEKGEKGGKRGKSCWIKCII